MIIDNANNTNGNSIEGNNTNNINEEVTGRIVGTQN